jgi:hypothetical protein
MRPLYKVGLLVVAIISVWYLFRDRDMHTRLFCAYGSVFVEFEETGNVWGTMMLDRNGRPVPCKDEEETPLTPSKLLTNYI